MNRLWRRYLRFFGSDIHADVDDELRFHLEQLVDDYVARGLSPEAAVVAAQERIGDLQAIERQLKAHDRAKQRRMRGMESLRQLISEVRLAVRALLRSPTFTVTVRHVAVAGD